MGVLRVNIGGEWIDISGNAGTDEVRVGANEPPEGVELWYDTDDDPTLAQGLMPVGGTTGQVLAKKSATDYDTQWVSPVLGYAQSVAAFATVAPHNVAQATGISVTVATEPIGARLRVTMQSNPYVSVASSLPELSIERNGVLIAQYNIPEAAISTTTAYPHQFSAIIPSSAGGTNVVYRVMLRNIGGSGALVSDWAGPVTPRWLLVETMGAAV